MRVLAKKAAFVFAATVMAAATAAAQKPAIDYDPAADFARLRSYTWAEMHATDASVEQRISIVANRTLAARYMTEGGKNSDVTMTAVEASKDCSEFATFYGNLTNWTWQRGWGSGFLENAAAPENVPLHTLIVDMYDTKTHRLLWRGTIVLPAEQAGKPEADQKLDKAVTQLMGRYPPKIQR